MMSTTETDTTYDDAPRIVIWEMTRACALSCRHCRAEAIPRRDPRELTTTEAFKLVDDVAACGRPLLVLTGGDPLMRDDIFKIVEYATSLGLPVSVSPSATGRLTESSIRAMAAAGVRRIAVSLDAPDAESHDAFRRVRGSYARTLAAIEYAREYGVGVQIHTTVSQANRERLHEFKPLLERLGIVLWSVFFVIPVGRAGRELCLSASEAEAAFASIYAIAQTAPFDVKTTEAPHYRRYVLQHGGTSPSRGAGIGDGRGFVFVSHVGEVQPSGFFPMTVGNVRERALLEIYRENETMRRLRRPATFDGKCGVCEFNRICGGSRARAYAHDGNPFGSDPSCTYVPTTWKAEHV
jgi:radical SAM protein with 4Fe4S-binding SPASM domain